VSRPLSASLVPLAAARVLPLRLAVLVALLVLFVALRRRADPELVALAEPGAEALAVTTRALARSSAWTELALLALPFAVARAATLARGWSDRRADWLRVRGAPPAASAAAIVAGSWAAGALVLALAALALELALGAGGAGDTPVPRFDRALATPALVLAADETEATLELGSLPGGATLVVPLHGAPGRRDGSLELRLSAGTGGGATRSARTRPGPRRLVSLEVPRAAGPGPWRLTLTRAGGPNVLVPAGGPRLLRAGARERDAAWTLLSRLLALWSSALGLAFLLARLWRPALSALLFGSAWLWLWTRTAPPRWLPAADLFDALALVGDGIVPAAPSPAGWWVALGTLALGSVALGRGLANAGSLGEAAG